MPQRNKPDASGWEEVKEPSGWEAVPEQQATAPPPYTMPKVQSGKEIVQQQTGIHPFKNPVYQAVAGPVRAVGSLLASPYYAAKAAFSAPTTPEEIAAQAGGGDLGLFLQRAVVNPAIQAHKTANQLRATGHPIQAVGAELGALPIIGPMGQEAGRRMAAGDVPGAVTESAANALMFGAPKAVTGAAKAAVPGAVTRFATESLPMQMINNLIKPMASDVKFGKNPAQAILEEGIVGNSLHDLAEKTFAKTTEVGRQIDAEAAAPQNANLRIDASSILDSIDQARQQAVKSGNQPLYKALNTAKMRIQWNWAAQRGKLVPTSRVNLRNMSPVEALELKRKIGDMVQWTEDPLTKGVNRAVGGAYGSLDHLIDQAVPEIKNLNERYSNLIGASKALERRIPVAERNAQWSLSDIGIAASGHPVVAAGRKIFSQPAVKTRVAQGLYKMGTHGARQPMIPRRPFNPRQTPPGAAATPGATQTPPGAPGTGVAPFYGQRPQPPTGMTTVQPQAGGVPATPFQPTSVYMGGELPAPAPTLALPGRGSQPSLPAQAGPTYRPSVWSAPPNAAGTFERTKPPLPENPKPGEVKGFIIDEQGNARPLPKGELMPPKKAKGKGKQISKVVAKNLKGKVSKKVLDKIQATLEEEE